MTSSTYADWKAPKTDGEILIWPEAVELPATIDHQRKQLAGETVRILGLPLSEVRAAVLTFLGHTTPTPLIATGHQTELHHPGVWMKNAVIDRLASRTGGRAVHLAVDTDQPKHLHLRYPTSLDGRTPPASDPITDDETLSTAAWTGRLSAPSPVYATAMERRFLAAEAGFGFESVAGRVLGSIRVASLEEGVLPPVLVSALHELDWWLGLRYDALLATPLWEYEGFLLLCSELIARADEYAACYNRALAEYRAEEGITNVGRPMPDLKVAQDVIELPLWLDDLDRGTRGRLSVSRSAGGWCVAIGGEKFVPDREGGFETAGQLRRFLRQRNCRLAPRALTLTTFMRLLVADLFVHGIGGGRYDQVTDRTFRSFFRVSPPAFAVATGTLYFPAAVGRSRACVPCVQHAGHQLMHAVLGDAKNEYLTAIAQAAPHSTARKQAFLRMHSELAAARLSSGAISQWNEKLNLTRQAATVDQVLFDRELFYGLQPKDRLESMIAKVGAAIG